MASPNKAPVDIVERLTFGLVGFVLAAVPLLVFFFGFGNVGLLGVRLGVDRWIAFLTGPAVDLAATGCVAASSYLSTRGWTERQLWPLHLAAVVLGLTMLALNTSGAIFPRRWGLAAFDAVGPMLLLGWGALAPWLWRNLTEAKQQRAIPAAAPTAPKLKDRAALAPTAPKDSAPRPESAAPTAPQPDAPRTPEGSAPAPQNATEQQQDAPTADAPITDELAKARQGANARTNAILDLMLTHGGPDQVTGAMVAEHFGVHPSNGKRALAKVRELPDLPTLLADRARETSRADDEPKRDPVVA